MQQGLRDMEEMVWFFYFCSEWITPNSCYIDRTCSNNLEALYFKLESDCSWNCVEKSFPLVLMADIIGQKKCIVPFKVDILYTVDWTVSEITASSKLLQKHNPVTLFEAH